MIRKLFALVLFALCFGSPALAGTNAERVALLASYVLADAAVTVPLTNPGAQSAYLRIRTTAEVGDATLTVTLNLRDGLTGTDATLCTLTPITENGALYYLLGSTVAAAVPITDVCDFPLPRDIDVVFTVTGTSTPTFTISSEIHYLGGAY